MSWERVHRVSLAMAYSPSSRTPPSAAFANPHPPVFEANKSLGCTY